MTLTLQAAEALEMAILHWRENVAAETPEEANLGVRDCALCDEFFYTGCDGCPVAIATGKSGCTRSPYNDAFRALQAWRTRTGTREQWRIAAQAELDFLISLRDPTEQEQA